MNSDDFPIFLRVSNRDLAWVLHLAGQVFKKWHLRWILNDIPLSIGLLVIVKYCVALAGIIKSV